MCSMVLIISPLQSLVALIGMHDIATQCGWSHSVLPTISLPKDSPQYQEPTPVFRPESPEGTPPPVPPYRGSPEPLTSLPTIPLSPNSHHSLIKTTPPEMIATYVNCTNGGCSKLPQKDPSPSLPSYENTPLPPRRGY